MIESENQGRKGRSWWSAFKTHDFYYVFGEKTLLTL